MGIDRDVSRAFWDQRSADAGDPRSVTLDDRDAPERARREVRLYQAWLQRQLRRLDVAPRAVADLGCGNGDWTVWFAGFAERLLAVDFSEGFVAHVRGRLANATVGDLDVRQADMVGFELPAGWDLVVAGAVTQYLDDDVVESLLARIARSLAPGGVLYLRTTVSRAPETRRSQTREFQGVYRTRAWYLDRLERAGFVVEAHDVATNFVGDEIAYRSFGDNLLAQALAWPIKGFRWSYRFARPTDVLVTVSRLAPSRPGVAARAI